MSGEHGESFAAAGDRGGTARARGQTALPWEVVETFPSTDPQLLGEWAARVAALGERAEPSEVVSAHVGRALALYWAVQEGLAPDAESNLRERNHHVWEAESAAAAAGDPDLVATAGLGRLYALWGPDEFPRRRGLLESLDGVLGALRDPVLSLRVREWRVLTHFDLGELDAARSEVEQFAAEAAARELPGFARREELWRANLAMLEGRIDDAVKINTDAISSTSHEAGSPFSFQNVAITAAIERYLRKGLEDVVESVRSIRASSPRVAVNWETGLAFSLAESGHEDEARELFEPLAADSFLAVPRDLNWLVTMQLLGLVAVRLADTARASVLLGLLEPFAHLDATHGSGYASYGPVGRTCGLLAATAGDLPGALGHLDRVIEHREHGPWTSLVRMERARVARTATGEAARAVRDRGWDARVLHAELTSAEADLRSMGMPGWADECAAERLALVRDTGAVPTLVLEGAELRLHGPDGSALVSGVGAIMLHELLVAPGESFRAAELERGGSDPAGVGREGDEAAPEYALDRRAIREYRQRLSELRGPGRPADEAERREAELLEQVLAGSGRRLPTSAEEERSRVRVTKAIRRCIGEIAEQCPPLGEHLRVGVSTGRRCSYVPPDGTRWETETA